jgi:alpha-D-ribose 1-methylphosphonate 5-triphosphate synthase subunit PhnH
MAEAMHMTALQGGFSDAPMDSAAAFRAAMEAMARPGRLQEVTGATPPEGLSVAAAVLLLTLVDRTTPLHLAPGHDGAAVRDWITFHCGAPLVAAEAAVFALGAWEALMPVSRFAIGTPEYPDRAATLIIEMPELRADGVTLTGPGIQTTAALNLPEPGVFAENHALFPLGWDAFFTYGSHLAALPRSTRIGAF